jgi:serine phosphatase RsbU (regulator of sigma subunit)
MRIVVADARGKRTLTVESTPFTIGRSSENHLQLADARVSRRHAEFVRDEEGWRVRDCGSRFGTFVNQARTEAALLKPGDRIRVGDTEIQVEVPQTQDHASSGSVSFDFRQVNALLAGLRALGSTRVLDEVLAIVLDSALEVTGAERGFILLADESGKLALRLARMRGGVTLGSAQTSQRIPDEVFASGSDRIVTDLMDDVHAGAHAGTVALGIRHVLCTPLRVVQYADGQEGRIGVLYLDSRERGYLQSVGALHALAAEAAVVIDNARLYQEVVNRERVAQELRIAAEMQRALLPPGHLATGALEISAFSTPCRDVGGDLFDYVERPDGVALTVADVAGKGTSAALLTAVVQGLFAAEAFSPDVPAVVVSRVNRALCRRAVASRFVTAFYGLLSQDGTFTYTNAGHNAPFLATSRGLQRLEDGGTILGVFEQSPYVNGHVVMSAGDALVVFSDGVTEALSASDEEFGDDRLAACLSGAREQSARETVLTVQRALADFCGSVPARDDVTLLVLKKT